jgi:hypothetical protein
MKNIPIHIVSLGFRWRELHLHNACIFIIYLTEFAITCLLNVWRNYRAINKSMEWHWRQSSLNNNHSPKKSVSDADLLTNSRPFFSVIADHPPVLFNYYFSGMCLCQNMFFFFFFFVNLTFFFREKLVFRTALCCKSD